MKMDGFGDTEMNFGVRGLFDRLAFLGLCGVRTVFEIRTLTFIFGWGDVLPDLKMTVWYSFPVSTLALWGALGWCV